MLFRSNGVLAAELSEGKNIEDAITMAVKASAISVTKKGAQSSMPSKVDVENTNKLFRGGKNK